MLFVVLAGSLVLVALLIGVAGYHWIAGYSYIDSLLNAAMVLTSMGQVNELNTDAAKLFASAYALFSSLIFLAVMSVIMAPVIHRFLHKFHVDKLT